MTQIKEVLDGMVTLALAVKEADGVLAKNDKVKISADLEVEEVDADYDEVFGYVLLANKEAGGKATIVTKGQRVTTETTGAAYSVGSLLALNSAGKTILAKGVRATGTITVVDYSSMATSTITVNGVVLTNGTTFTAATSNDATAKLIADAINARVPGVRAYATAAVVTVEALDAGAAGNAVTLATNMASGVATVSGATLSGGKEFRPIGQALEAASGADQTKQVLWF